MNYMLLYILETFNSILIKIRNNLIVYYILYFIFYYTVFF